MLILDTNAYSALGRGDEKIRRTLERSDGIGMSVVVVGELEFGFRHGSKTSENLARMQRFLDGSWVEVLEVTRTTADRFGRLAAQLRVGGTPIPTNDVWIAAQALEHGAELLSFDQHFAHVPGLVWIDPASL